MRIFCFIFMLISVLPSAASACRCCLITPDEYRYAITRFTLLFTAPLDLMP